MVHFLSYVDIPLDTEIRLKCVFGGNASLPQLLSCIQKRLSPNEDEREVSTPKQPVRSMSIDGAPPRTFFVTCSTSEGGYKYRALSLKENAPYVTRAITLNHDWDRGIPLKMDLKDLSTALTQPMMVDVFHHLSLAYLSSLAVYFPDGIDLSTSFWKELFNLASKLRFVKLRHTALRSFVATLAPDRHGWRGQNQELAARTLEEIELEQVSFATVCAAGEGVAIFTCDTTFQCLCDALARRRHAGCPLKRITILDSLNVGTDEQVDKLRGCLRGNLGWSQSRVSRPRVSVSLMRVTKSEASPEESSFSTSPSFSFGLHQKKNPWSIRRYRTENVNIFTNSAFLAS